MSVRHRLVMTAAAAAAAAALHALRSSHRECQVSCRPLGTSHTGTYPRRNSHCRVEGSERPCQRRQRRWSKMKWLNPLNLDDPKKGWFFSVVCRCHPWSSAVRFGLACRCLSHGPSAWWFLVWSRTIFATVGLCINRRVCPVSVECDGE